MDEHALPSPIACVREALAQSMERGETIAACIYARDVFEVTTRCLLALLVLDGLAHPTAKQEEFLDAIVALTGSRAPSHGRWVALLRRVAEAHASITEREHLVAASASGVLLAPDRRRGGPAQPLQILDQGVKFRNEFAHGALGSNRDRLQVVASSAINDLEQLFGGLAQVWTETKWVIRLADGRRLPLRAESLAKVHNDAVTAARLCVDDGRGRHLVLHPVVRVVWIPEITGAGVAVFEKRCFSATGRYTSDRYVDYTTGRDAFVSEFWELGDATALEALRRDAAVLLDPGAASYPAELEKRVHALRLGVSDHGAILPRSALALEVRKALEASDAAVITLTAEAGRGKSWFAAGIGHGRHPNLTSWKDRALVLHLGGGSRQSATSFAREFERAIEDRIDRVVDLGRFRDDLPRWRKQVADGLREAVQHATSILVVVDGVDEILDGSTEPCALDILPDCDAMPRGVHLLLTGRPEHQMGDRVRSAWTRLCQAAAAAGQLTQITVANDAADQVQLVEEVLKQGDRPAPTAAMVRACHGSVLRARHIRRLSEFDPATDFERASSQLYNAYFKEIESALSSSVYQRIHGPVLAVLAVARERLPLDVIADIVGVHVEDIYFAALDLRDSLVSSRIEHESLPSLTIGHAELRDHVRESPDLFNDASRRLALYVHRQLDADDVAPGEAVVPLPGQQARMRAWIGDDALVHLTFGLPNDLLDAVVARDVEHMEHDQPTLLIERVAGHLDPARPFGSSEAVRTAAQRVLDSIGRQVGASELAQHGVKLRTVRLRLHWTLSAAWFQTSASRAGEILELVEESGLIAKPGASVAPDDLERTAIHWYKKHEVARAMNHSEAAVAHLRASLHLRREQLRHGRDPQRALDALVSCNIALITRWSSTTVVDRDALLEEAREWFHQLDAFAAGDEQAASDREVLRARLAHTAGAVSSVGDAVVLLAEAEAAYERALITTPWNRHTRYSAAANLRYLAELCLRVNKEHDAAQALRRLEFHLSTLLRTEPSGNSAYIHLHAQLYRLKAQLAARTGDLAASAALLAQGLGVFSAATVTANALIQNELRQMRAELKSLSEGDPRPGYRSHATFRYYDPGQMAVVGGWSAGDGTVEWTIREWTLQHSPTGDGPGVHVCQFLYTRGSDRLDVREVEVCCDGTAVATDRHEGTTGFYSIGNCFEFDLTSAAIPSGSFAVRASVRSGPDSNGRVMFGWFPKG